MSKIAINTTNKEVISVSAKKAVPLAIKQATGASSGGGGNINITPYITEDGGNVVFNYFTPKQMAEVYIWLEGGNLRFELTTDEEGQYSLTTKCDIQELDGMFLVGGEEFIVNTIIDTLTIDLKGYKVNEVRIEGIDADLLDADFTWKLAEIGNKVNGVAQESTSQEILEEVSGIKDSIGTPTLTIPDTTAEQELAPNVVYIFANRTSELTLTLGAEVIGKANEYHFFIECGETAPTITFPSGIEWNGGNAPTIAANKTYEVSILNNIAAYFEI